MLHRQIPSKISRPGFTEKHSCSAGPARIQASSPARKGVVVLPGLGNNKKDYDAIAADLEEQGLVVNVAEVTRIDWLRNAAGLVDINYWKGTLNPRPTVDWYDVRCRAAVSAMIWTCWVQCTDATEISGRIDLAHLNSALTVWHIKLLLSRYWLAKPPPGRVAASDARHL